MPEIWAFRITAMFAFMIGIINLRIQFRRDYNMGILEAITTFITKGHLESANLNFDPINQ